MVGDKMVRTILSVPFYSIPFCPVTNSKIDDTRLKVDRAAKKIDGIDVDLVQLLLTAQPYKLCFPRVDNSVFAELSKD